MECLFARALSLKSWGGGQIIWDGAAFVGYATVSESEAERGGAKAARLSTLINSRNITEMPKNE